MADEVVLLDFWASVFCMRVKIAMAEKGIKYEYKEENLLQDKSSFLLKMNPVHKKIPVLIHNGRPVCKSQLLVQCIDEVWKETSPLLPSDPYLRTQARFWADLVDKKVFNSGWRICSNKREEKEAGKELKECIKLLDEELGEKPYFGGEKFGYIDLSLIPFYTWFYCYETFGNFSIEAERSKIITWAKRCLQKESVFMSLPDPQKIYQIVE